MADFQYEVFVHSRKKRKCEWCGEYINKGEHVLRVNGISNGDFYRYFLHRECASALDRSSSDPIMETDGFMPHEQERGKSWEEMHA